MSWGSFALGVLFVLALMMVLGFVVMRRAEEAQLHMPARERVVDG